MGNSEVGHLNIGAGRIVYQDLVKINRACADGSILKNKEIVSAYEYAKQNGKNGATYDRRGGLCLETQYFPDSINKPQFPSCVFGEDKEYDTVTVYRFTNC